MAKKTARENFEEIYNIMIEEDRTELAEFVKKQIATIDNRTAVGKEYRAKKRAAAMPDELINKIAAMLTETPITVNDILNALDDDSISKEKVVNRMTSLINAKRASKCKVTVDDRKITGYTIYIEEEAEQ